MHALGIIGLLIGVVLWGLQVFSLLQKYNAGYPMEGNVILWGGGTVLIVLGVLFLKVL